MKNMEPIGYLKKNQETRGLNGPKIELTFRMENNFSDFDRIFYLKGKQRNIGSLLLFSVKKQKFVEVNMEDMTLSTISLDTDKKYHEAELYDEKLFCINRETLSIDVFFDSKKQRLFNKRSFYFTKTELKLAENFQFIIWKHATAGVMYRCLLGPLNDGRYINFDLREKCFDSKASVEHLIERVFFVNLALDDERENLPKVLGVMDEGKLSIICYSEGEQSFFEYNEFSDNCSRQLNVVNGDRIKPGSLKRMYFYYPYDYFMQKERNQLKSDARDRNIRCQTDLGTYVRNKYKEILLCIEGKRLQKMYLMEEDELRSKGTFWTITGVDIGDYSTPIDLTVDEDDGEIYVMYRDGISCLKNSGRKAMIFNEQQRNRRAVVSSERQRKRKEEFLGTNWSS